MSENLAESPSDSSAELLRIPVDRITADPNQPRRHFDDGALAELADSIRVNGLIQPITVRPKLLLTAMGEGDYDYMIVDGERRYRAAKLAGRDVIPCIVRADLTTRNGSVSVLQLIANLQRADLTLWETAQGCRALVDAIGLEAAAQRLGYSKPWVSMRANLLKLDAAIVDLVTRGLLNSIDVAHDLYALSQIDETGAHNSAEMLRRIADGDPPSREAVRGLLQEARDDMEAQAARERARQQRLDDEAAAKAARDPLELTPPDDEDEDDDAPAPKPASKPSKVEDQYQREARLREEAWTELMPECRKLAREARKAMLAALEEIPEDGARNFELTVGQPLTSRDAPAKPQGAIYLLDVRGNTDDAGLIIEALDPAHEVMLNTRVTIAQLRQIEALLGEFFPVRTCAGYGGAGTADIHGSKLAHAAALIKQTHAARLEAQRAAQANAQRIARLIEADDDAIEPAQAATSAHADEPVDTTAQIARFLAACTQRADGMRIKAAELYAAYCAWCTRHRELPVSITDHRWGQGIEAAGIEKKRSNGFVYIGILLLIGDAA